MGGSFCFNGLAEANIITIISPLSEANGNELISITKIIFIAVPFMGRIIR